MSGETSYRLCIATILVVSAFMGQACHGWVLGARASPFSNLNPNRLSGPDEFHLNPDIAGYTAGGDGGSVMDHFSKRSSSSDDDIPFRRSSNDDTPFQLCGRALVKVVRYVCREYYQRRGHRSADKWLSSIFSPEDYKVQVRLTLLFR